MKNLKHLVKGKQLTMNDDEGKNFTLTGVVLIDATKVSTQYSLKDIEEHFTIYIDPKDIELERLQSIIDRQTKELQAMVAKANEPKVRKRGKHLTSKGKADICQYAIDHSDYTNSELGEHFSISQSTIGTILNDAKIRIIKRRA